MLRRLSFARELVGACWARPLLSLWQSWALERAPFIGNGPARWWAWNSFFFPLVIATKQWLMPMSVRIIDFMGRFTFRYDMIAATTVILFTPILALYLITQRSFHRGITFGALKD